MVYTNSYWNHHIVLREFYESQSKWNEKNAGENLKSTMTSNSNQYTGFINLEDFLQIPLIL